MRALGSKSIPGDACSCCVAEQLKGQLSCLARRPTRSSTYTAAAGAAGAAGLERVAALLADSCWVEGAPLVCGRLDDLMEGPPADSCCAVSAGLEASELLSSPQVSAACSRDTRCAVFVLQE